MGLLARTSSVKSPFFFAYFSGIREEPFFCLEFDWLSSVVGCAFSLSASGGGRGWQRLM
jgi:hypothetical protein